MVLSRRLFDKAVPCVSEELSALCIGSSPVKTDHTISVQTSNIKRELFQDSKKDCHLQIVERSVRDKGRNTTEHSNLEDLVKFLSSDRQKSCKDVKDVLNILADNGELIADGSRHHALPTVPGKHQDLKSITPQTLADVVNGNYNEVIDSYRIIDCRYPYEYEGGHVKGAENMYLQETILNLLVQPTSEKQVIIFHCEFSSERGPKMMRFLRSKDREINKENYPSLIYPEIYLLDGGYKEFFYKFSEHCDPVSYRPMLHSDYSAELRYFRTKSKSWTAEEKRRVARKAMRF